MTNNKKYPIEYSKEEILTELVKLIDQVSNNTLSKGVKEELLFKIQIGELYLNSLEIKRNNKNLLKIIKNNQKTSKITWLLSSLIIIISAATLFYTIFNKKRNYNNNLNSIITDVAYNKSRLDSCHSNLVKIHSELVKQSLILSSTRKSDNK